MNLKKFTSIAISAAITASCFGGFAITASAADGDNGLPADEMWSTNDSELVVAATAAADKTAFGPINGISGYGQWKQQSVSATYTHTDGQTYSFTSAFRAGSGSTTNRSFYFTPKEACIVTVAYTSQAGRPVYICQGGKTLASGEEGAAGGIAATISADVEDPTAGDVYVYGGSSNKDIFAIFADYYDPNVIVNQTVSGKINYNGTADTSTLKLVFKNTNEGEEYKVDFGTDYSVELRQNRSYDVYVEENGVQSNSVSTTLNTNSVSVAKIDKTFDVDVVDIAPIAITGDVVVHEVNNDGTDLNLDNVELTFTADDNPEFTYKAKVVDNKISVTMMPNHSYTITASGNDGYALSALSGSYLMAAGDTNPFKNILFTEIVENVPFKSEVHVGADKEYSKINDAITAVKAMTRDNSEEGRVTILVDPGVYTEQVIVDDGYITIKAADANNRPEIQWYYGIGYLYYSSAGSQYYSEDYAVAKTEKGTVTRWGSACRIIGQNVKLENLIVKNTFNCEVTEAELADGVEPAMNNEYSDTNSKPDRTVEGYDAKSQAATERAAAIALDGNYAELYNCDFVSSQDTFYTNNTAYVKNCYIEGGTDYLFGGNSVVFEDCTLAWHGYSDAAKGGYITANKNGAVAVPGTPNAAANGYYLKNCTVANSKYYPENKFAAGSWGRNWGGAETQVVFDGVKLDGVDMPGAWVKMGGELNTSILYVANVTDKNGAVVDTTGTSFNPNGTMEANNYTPMAATDYFGTWVPKNYDGEVPPTTPPASEEPTEPVPPVVEGLTAQTASKSWTFTLDKYSEYGTVSQDSKGNNVLDITSNVVVDNIQILASESKKVTIDGSKKTFGDTPYTERLKFNGKGDETARAIKFIAGADGTVVIDAAHASGTPTDIRTLNVVHGAATDTVDYSNGDTVHSNAIAVKANEVVVIYPTGGINLYGVSYTVAGSVDPTDPTAPPASEEPSDEPTQNPGMITVYAEDGVVVTAVYNGDNTLASVAVSGTVKENDEVQEFPEIAGQKVFVWNSLDNMKPAATKQVPAASASEEPATSEEPTEPAEKPTEDAAAAANIIWKADKDAVYTAGMDLGNGLSLVFGEGDAAPVYSDFTTSAEDPTPKTKMIGGVEFTGYVSSQANGSWSGTTVDPTKTTVIKYTADNDGILTVYLDSVGTTKKICVGQDGMKKVDIEAAATLGTGDAMAFPVTVQSGESYYIYIAGSKGRFCGAGFETVHIAKTYTWIASESEIGKTAGAELMSGLTLNMDNSSTNKSYVTGAEDAKWVDGVLTGSALVYVAPAAGTLTVSFNGLGNVDQQKTVCIATSADEIINEYTTAGLDKENPDLSAELTAGTTYYIYGAGTKARFAKVVFQEAE